MRCSWLLVSLLVLFGAGVCARRVETRDAAPTAMPTPASAPVPPADRPEEADGPPEEMVVDPYCGVRLRRSQAAASAEYGGRTWWFCLADHREAFLADPERALRVLRELHPDVVP